jgi:metal-responsive CopG/Arc/MetJ family transcriptional regulator
MPTVKIAVTIDQDLLTRLDRLVAEQQLPSRSRVVGEAVRDKLARMEKTRLARECAKLDKLAKQALGEEGMPWDLVQWPEY